MKLAKFGKNKKRQRGFTALKAIFLDPGRFFLLTGGLFGLIFVFLFPPFQVIDEPSHFQRAYQLAEGHLQGVIIPAKPSGMQAGGDLPKSVIATIQDYSYFVFHYENKLRPGLIRADLSRKLDYHDQSFEVFNNTVVYPPLTYLPQTAGVRLSMFFNASPLVSLYIARLFTLAFWLACIYAAIRAMPYGKWAVVVLSLFPMMLTQAASVSADATLNALTFLAGALVLKAVHGRVMTLRQLGLMAAAGLALALVKLPNAFIMLFALAIPARNFPAVFGKKCFIGLLSAAMVLLIIGWNIWVAKLHVDLLPYLSVSGQSHFLLHHPLTFLKAILMYPLSPQMDGTVTQFYGLLGWNEVRIPLLLVIYGYVTLLATLGASEKNQPVISRSTRLWAFATTSVLALATFTLIYLSWVPVGFKYVYGLWGRYFLAGAILLPPLLQGVFKLEAASWNRARGFIILTIPLALSITTFLVWNRYYYHFLLGCLAQVCA